jgi:SAM-dependent methyltransferase
LGTFSERSGCPFCERKGEQVSTVRYHETAEADRSLPDIAGALYSCGHCGVMYPSHCYSIEAIGTLYRKTLADLTYFDRSPMQRMRKAYMKAVIRGMPLLDALSLRVFQIPTVSRHAGLRILDVGCGFGEFLDIFRDLGNQVTGTEVIEQLAGYCRSKGHDVRFGELERLHLDGKFDLVILRAVLYRTRNPVQTLGVVKSLLAPGGEISLVDPCPIDSDYFFRKQFPQGQFYIADAGKYFRVLSGLGFACKGTRLIYGRPRAPLRSIRLLGNLAGLAELLIANALRIRPYMLSYRLTLQGLPLASSKPRL